jgi:hypothetical protein
MVSFNSYGDEKNYLNFDFGRFARLTFSVKSILVGKTRIVTDLVDLLELPGQTAVGDRCRFLLPVCWAAVGKFESVPRSVTSHGSEAPKIGKTSIARLLLALTFISTKCYAILCLLK